MTQQGNAPDISSERYFTWHLLRVYMLCGFSLQCQIEHALVGSNLRRRLHKCLWAIFAVALACSVSPIAYSQSIPTLNALTRSSGATVSPGSTASFTVSYTPGSSAVTFAQVNVSDASGTNRNFVMGTPTSGGTVSSSVDSSWLNGAYTVNYVAFSDSTGRITFYYRDRRIVASPTLSGAPTAHTINLAAQDFQVSSGTTTLPIVALQPSSQTAVVGGSAMFSVSV